MERLFQNALRGQMSKVIVQGMCKACSRLAAHFAPDVRDVLNRQRSGYVQEAFSARAGCAEGCAALPLTP